MKELQRREKNEKQMLWKNKILVRADPPFSSFYYFHLILLQNPYLSLKLHSLCWKLSRRSRLACFSDSTDIYIIYQKSQSDSALHVVKELRECLPVSDTVQADTDDGFVFLVSPEVVRFSRLKIMDLLGPKMKERFHGGEGVVVDEYCFATSCSVLPSLCEGHVIGLSRLLPGGEDFEQMGELWSFKHGLVLPNDYFVHILFTDEGCANKHWFPSSFILQGSGLTPAPRTIRATNAVFALESFMRIIEAWDFFDGGLLRIKGACRLGISSDLPVWAKATCSIDNHILTVNDGTCLPATVSGKISFLRGLLSNHDFRSPKPSLGLLSHSETSEHIHIQGSTAFPSKGIQSGTHLCVQDVLSINMTTKFRPLFKGRKAMKKTIQSGNRIPSSPKSGRIENEACLLTVTESKRADLHMDEPLPSCLNPGPVLKVNAAIEKDGALRPFKRNLNPKEDAAVPKDGMNLHISSQTSINKENARVFLDKGSNKGLSNTRKDIENLPKKQGKQLSEIAARKENEKSMPKKQVKQLSDIATTKESMLKKQAKQPSKITIGDVENLVPKKRAKQPSDISAREEDREENPQKKWTKHQIDSSDIIAKVIDYHARGQLGSLMVPELKSFLGAKKAKVGGKKEDLIQRIVTILA
ncbi:uncharacterized protein LOC131251421 isoform X3 [Magnolia sinica]|uniref:uncharacterized protein LOC131251421 isoform X3 n=1 Tax=Magnolia sinica TaxID=86752 RepID=UPI00265A9FF3|nr:uncharacterized protein LOC131251421 isoform X3 [Magnolia sinica]